MPNHFETLNKCPNPLCESLDIIVLFKAPDRLAGSPGEFFLSQCQKCKIRFQNPCVKERFIGEYYSQELGYYHPNQARDKNEGLKNKTRNFFKKQTLINHFNYPIGKKIFWFFCLTWPLKNFLKASGFPAFKKSGSVLEIGCSHGEFLQELRDFGWNVFGVEMDQTSSQYAREKRGLNVQTQAIQDSNFNEKMFDVAIMRMVLEHLHEPFDKLKKITAWLKPNGQLIFSIPYYGVEFAFFKEYYYALQLPHHITFFNKKIIKKYLQFIGYKDIKFYHQFFDRDMVASSQYKYQENKSAIYKILGYSRFARFFIVKPLVFVLALLGKTSRITVRAIKNET